MGKASIRVRRPPETVFGPAQARDGRLLRGEDLESVRGSWRITAARAAQWRESVSGGGPGRLTSRERGMLGTQTIVGCKPRSVSC